MGKQTMLVNVHEDETRIALVENDVLVGLHVQQTDRERKVGNIYRGRIVKINPAFQAAFVDYGGPRNGFLSISDVNFHMYRPKDKDGDRGRPRIQSVLREGQSVMVQIIKEGLSNKGSALTTFISLAGRYMVMSPHSDRSGVSRKIEDVDTRRRLKDLMEGLAAGEDLGIIIRTAGIDRPVADLKKDLESLRKEWKSIESKYEKNNRPGLLYQEPSPIVRVLRDYFTDSVQEVWVDDAEGYQEALKYIKATLPKYQKRLKLYVGDKSLFSSYRIEEQIEALDSAKVPLKSGGSVVIEATEALVSVDVNSGRSNQSQDIEDTALRTNLEGAAEIARQLRLRNMGGLIVIDFIDMMQAKNRRTVETAVADALKDDKARTTIGSISQFGLLELSRQRIDMELSRGLRVHCPNCGGTGHIPTVNSSANNVLRKIRELAATGKYTEIHGQLPLDSANFLLNEKREALRDLEMEFEIRLRLEPDPDLPAGHSISLHGGGSGEEDGDPRGDERPAGEAGAQGDLDEAGRKPRRRRRRRGGREERDLMQERGLDDRPHRVAEEDDAGDDGHEDVHEEIEPDDALVADADAESDGGKDRAPSGRGRRGRGRGRGRSSESAEHEQSGADGPPTERPQQGRRDQFHEPAAASGKGSADDGKGMVFRSQHIITDPEAVDKMPPRVTRSNPFRAIADRVEPNTVLFDSASPGGLRPWTAARSDNGADAEADDDGGDGKPGRKRSRRSSRGKRGGAAAAEEPVAPMSDAAPEPTQAEAPRADPPRAEPPRAEPPRAEPPRAEALPDAHSDDLDDLDDPPPPARVPEDVEIDEETGLPDNIGNLKSLPPELKARAGTQKRRPNRPPGRQGERPAGRAGPRQPRRPRGDSGGPGRDGGGGAQAAATDASPAARRSRGRRGRGRGGRSPAEGSPASGGGNA